MEYKMAVKLDLDRVRLVLMQGSDELLRASLPPPARFWSPQPAKALLESLAMWLDASLRVVLDAADPVDGWSLELSDELGIGCTVLYEVVAAKSKRRRPRRLCGVGDFRDVRQLCLLDRLDGGGR